MPVTVTPPPNLQRLIDNVKRGTPTALEEIGKYMYRSAQNSIKPSDYYSKPGNQPHTRKRRKLLKKAIAWARDTKSVMIGPRASFMDRIGHIHEFGGVETTPKKVFVKRPNWKLVVGGHGPIRTKNGLAFANLWTEAQVERSRQLADEVIGYESDNAEDARVMLGSVMENPGRETIWSTHRVYPKRPFMGPTLEMYKKWIPNALRGVLKGRA